MAPTYVKTNATRLRDAGFDEKWLQDRVNDDPSILGLGELVVITREHNQPTGGRIDFLMYDPEDGIRYEIELMLGRVDESHIIRTLEYWDVERKRFPRLQHRAVIVAEEITNRFFNIISLLNQAIPLIAIQLSSFQLDERIVLHFTKVLDLPEQESDEEGAIADVVDRAYWEKRSSQTSMKLADRMMSLVPTVPGPLRVTYNRGHIAVGTTERNFLWLHPRKGAHLYVHLRVDGPQRDSALANLESADIFSGPRGKEIKLRLSGQELTQHEALIRGMVEACEAQSRE
jgi:hypothetical protein